MAVDMQKLLDKLEYGKLVDMGYRVLKGSNDAKLEQLAATNNIKFVTANSSDFIEWLFKYYECGDEFMGCLLDEYAFYIGGDKWMVVKEVATTAWTSEHAFEVVNEQEYYKFREEREGWEYL